MKRILTLIPGTLLELLGVALLLAIYWWAAQGVGVVTGKELLLMEASRELWSPQANTGFTLGQGNLAPVSPLMMALLSLVFKGVAPSLEVARLVVLGLAGVALWGSYYLAARLFHQGVGILAAGLLVGTWGFFTNSHTANGAMLYLIVVAMLFLFFFQWFESAFRSRTYARSLYVNFILLGVFLGLAFWTYGLPGVLFPVLVMVTSIVLSRRYEIVTDMNYVWMLVPFGVLVGIWLLLGSLMLGPGTFFASLMPLQFSLSSLGQPLLYMLPLLLLVLPSMMNKDILNRALISYQKAGILLVSWLAWGIVFLVLFSGYNEAFALLVAIPVLYWLAFYLSEVFRNPIIPLALQLMVDGMIVASLVLSVVVIVLTFQLVPPEFFGVFLLLSFSLPVISVLLLTFRDLSISRFMPVYLVPCALVFCLFISKTLVPMIQYDPAVTFAPMISPRLGANPQALVVEWQRSPYASTMLRFLLPLGAPVVTVDQQSELEARIQTRTGPLFMVLPEKQFFRLPLSVRETGYQVKTSWQWTTPVKFDIVVNALKDQTLDFRSLSEPVILFEVPVPEGN